MSAFSIALECKLSGKLNRRHVQSREVDGRSIDYIEGWFAISEANAIFGYSGWDREMTHFERLFERTRADVTSCCYVARVRIRVRTGRTVVVREGTGCGSATAGNSSEAHERAFKAAETDATKRALATFGNRFGLGLYDKEQNGVTAKKAQPQKGFTIYDPTGAPFAQNLSAESFCTGLRQLVETVSEMSELEALARCNKDGISRLRHEAPKLKTAKNIHYADILERLIEERLKLTAANPRPNGHGPELVSPSTTHPSNGNGSSAPPAGEPPPLQSSNSRPAEMAPALVPLKPSKIAPGPRIDKSLLSIATERRLRDRDHLKFVASHPCLVCGRQPSQAHHLTFAQKRGLSLKVSDEFTVPLCAVHHDELHQAGPERPWWDSQGIAPEAIAAELWKNSRTVRAPEPAGTGSSIQEKIELSKPPTLHA